MAQLTRKELCKAILTSPYVQEQNKTKKPTDQMWDQGYLDSNFTDIEDLKHIHNRILEGNEN